MEARLYEFAVGVEASAQPDAGTPTLASDLVTKGYADSTYANAKADSIALATTDKSKAVVFATAFADNLYQVFAIIKDTTMTAADQVKQPVNITAQNAAGFTATWTNEVESATAVLSWIAVRNNNV